jgi:polar amino acid transport system substrate-binding protein
MSRKALVFGLLCSLCCAAENSSAGKLEDIRAKSVLVVGTKADYPPFGYRDAQGKIIGLEPDLAADVAKRLGVKLELVPVTAANRMQLLQEGKIDLMIATMGVNEEREKAVGVIYPNYYASGVAILANRKSGIKDENDLNGKLICALKGAFYNSKLQSDFTNRDLLLFGSVTECEAALVRAECDGLVYDDVLLFYKSKIEKEKWKDYEVIVLAEFDPVPWGLAVRREEKYTSWGRFMSGVAADWLRSEQLLTWERNWLGTNTSWLKAVHIRMMGDRR